MAANAAGAGVGAGAGAGAQHRQRPALMEVVVKPKVPRVGQVTVGTCITCTRSYEIKAVRIVNKADGSVDLNESKVDVQTLPLVAGGPRSWSTMSLGIVIEEFAMMRESELTVAEYKAMLQAKHLAASPGSDAPGYAALPDDPHVEPTFKTKAEMTALLKCMNPVVPFTATFFKKHKRADLVRDLLAFKADPPEGKTDHATKVAVGKWVDAHDMVHGPERTATVMLKGRTADGYLDVQELLYDADGKFTGFSPRGCMINMQETTELRVQGNWFLVKSSAKGKVWDKFFKDRLAAREKVPNADANGGGGAQRKKKRGRRR